MIKRKISKDILNGARYFSVVGILGHILPKTNFTIHRHLSVQIFRRGKIETKIAVGNSHRASWKQMAEQIEYTGEGHEIPNQQKVS